METAVKQAWQEALINFETFFREFGVSIETCTDDTSQNPKLFLKYRLFPTSEIFDEHNFTQSFTNICTDKYYDKIINRVLYPTRGILYKSRKENDQPMKIVKQSRWDLTQNCHISYEEDWLSLDGLECFLIINYTRQYSIKNGIENLNIYLDTVKIDQLGLDYSVVSYRLEINLENIQEKIVELFTGVLVQETIDRNTSTVSELLVTEEHCHEILEDETIALFPMYSKFMFMLQMSPYFEYYHHTSTSTSPYSSYDPIKNPLHIRLLVATDADSLLTKSYNKEWIWLTQYQICYLQLRLGNCDDRFTSLDRVLRSIESDRRKIFGETSRPMDLVIDDSSYF
jgi:hypothetical protein